MTDDDVDNMTQNAIMNMFPCILATHTVSYECTYILSYRKAPCSFLKKIRNYLLLYYMLLF